MLKLNKSRTFDSPVTVKFTDENGKPASGKMSATFKIVGADTLEAEENAKKRLLDLVLVDVGDIELADDAGAALSGSDLIDACKADPCIAPALIRTYNENTGKKNLT